MTVMELAKVMGDQPIQVIHESSGKTGFGGRASEVWGHVVTAEVLRVDATSRRDVIKIWID